MELWTQSVGSNVLLFEQWGLAQCQVITAGRGTDFGVMRSKSELSLSELSCCSIFVAMLSLTTVSPLHCCMNSSIGALRHLWTAVFCRLCRWWSRCRTVLVALDEIVAHHPQGHQIKRGLVQRHYKRQRKLLTVQTRTSIARHRLKNWAQAVRLICKPSAPSCKRSVQQF